MTALPKMQQAQYGDSAKLEQLGAGRLTNNPAASVQVWKDMKGGRPAETDPVKLAMKQAMGQQQASPEQAQYTRRFDTMAMQHATIAKWMKLASSPSSGPLTRAWAASALKVYRQQIGETRNSTPFFR